MADDYILRCISAESPTNNPLCSLPPLSLSPFSRIAGDFAVPRVHALRLQDVRPRRRGPLRREAVVLRPRGRQPRRRPRLREGAREGRVQREVLGEVSVRRAEEEEVHLQVGMIHMHYESNLSSRDHLRWKRVSLPFLFLYLQIGHLQQAHRRLHIVRPGPADGVRQHRLLHSQWLYLNYYFIITLLSSTLDSQILNLKL